MTEKKLACSFLVAMLMFSITVLTVEGAPPLPKLFVDPPIYTATQLGEAFTININITNVQDLAGFEFKLGYNTTLLDALNAVEGPFPKPPTSTIVQINEPEGYVWMMVTCNPSDGNGTLATITFNVTYADSASCTLNLYDTKIVDSTAEPLTHDVEDGNYEFVVLNITVATDKPSYNQGETVRIYGNLTLDGSPHQGLVALEVDDPWNRGIVRRTLQIGPTPPPGEITIIYVVPCGGPPDYSPRENFTRGTLAYFNVTVRNSGTELKRVAVTSNVYDGNMVPLGAPTDCVTIGPGIFSFIGSVNIPNRAYTGTGKVYASVFREDLPRYGGVPLCPEKSANFTITGSGGGAASLEIQDSGNYTLTFGLSQNPIAGNYTVYATSSYLKQNPISTITFELILLGDVNGDGHIDVVDMLTLKVAITKIMLGLMTHEEALAENPLYDLVVDGKVDVSDMLILKVILTKLMLPP